MKFFAVLALCIVGAIAAPLTTDQAELVKSLWDKVRHSESDILYNIFKEHPDIQSRFPKFVGKDLEAIKDTADFAVHAGRIVGFVSEIISLIGNPSNAPAVQTLVKELGSNHRSRGIPKEQFNEFRASLTAYVSAHNEWSDAAAAAWNQGTDNIYEIIFAALEH